MHGGFLVNLVERTSQASQQPDALQVAKPVVAGDRFGAEMLELGDIGAGFLGQEDQILRPPQIAVVIRADVRDEADRMPVADGMAGDLKFRLPTSLALHAHLPDNSIPADGPHTYTRARVGARPGLCSIC